MYKQMYERTNGWKISSFYRTLSPIGAAAQKTDKKRRFVRGNLIVLRYFDEFGDNLFEIGKLGF